MKIKLIIAGSRSFDDYEMFSRELDKYLATLDANCEITVLSGHCSGTDLMGERYASEHSFELEIFPPDWRRYGRGAGPKRNQQMVDIADCVIAFDSGGAGTRSLITLARKKGLSVTVVSL